MAPNSFPSSLVELYCPCTTCWGNIKGEASYNVPVAISIVLDDILGESTFKKFHFLEACTGLAPNRFSRFSFNTSRIPTDLHLSLRSLHSDEPSSDGAGGLAPAQFQRCMKMVVPILRSEKMRLCISRRWHRDLLLKDGDDRSRE